MRNLTLLKKIGDLKWSSEIITPNWSWVKLAPIIFTEIIEKQVIAIDVGNSPFADVLLPITIAGKPSILAFQCKQYAAKVNIQISFELH